MRAWVRPALEIGPLLIFFLVNNKFGLMNGTMAFVIATAVALPLAWYLEKRLPVMPLVSGVFVLVFGGVGAAGAASAPCPPPLTTLPCRICSPTTPMIPAPAPRRSDRAPASRACRWAPLGPIATS